MEGACCSVEKLWELVLNLSWEQLRYLVKCQENIVELNRLHVELSHKRSTLQHRIDEATNNAENIEEEVQYWLLRMEEISGKVQEFQQEVNQAKTGCSLSSSPNINLWLRYKLSKSAKELAQEVARIEAKLKFDKVSFAKPPLCMPELTNKESNGGTIRVSVMNETMGALQDPNIKIIGLWGHGGVGKTTIAREAAKRARDEKIFEKVVEVVIPESQNVGDIHGQIARMLGMTIDHKDEIMLADRVPKRLMEERNMLLILDDLWEEVSLSKVGISFIDGKECEQEKGGCKILLTSRQRDLLQHKMECQKIIEVGVLSDEESWELFKEIAKLFDDWKDQALIPVGVEIVRKCQGLPLAIVSIAKVLRNKDLIKWKDVLNQLKSHSERDITKGVDSILRVSYDHLSRRYQDIFLLSAMLPHDPLIKDLLMYSRGLGWLERAENMEEAQNAVTNIVRELKASSLFLDSSISHDHFTIHDMFRDVALRIAAEEQHAFIKRNKSLGEWPDGNMHDGYTSISLVDVNVSDLPKELHGPKLKFFLLHSKNPNLTIPDMFFKSTEKLEVVSFTNVNFSSLPSLSFLRKLKTLCLHSCLLKDITEIRSLNKLKILSLAYSEIEQLPSELACLTSLQMLNVAHCFRFRVIAPGVLSSLKKLEVLCMEASFNWWEAKGSSKGNENASLDELKGLPISSLDVHIPDASILPKDLFLGFNLERYRIFIGEDWEWRGKYGTSKTLKLKLNSNIHLELGVRKLLEGVEDLYLKGSNGIDNVLYSLDVGGFRNMKHFHVKYNDDIRYIVFNWSPLKVAFPVLKTLELEYLKRLEKLCQGPIPASFFQNLKVIKVYCCRRLKSIFSISMVESFSRLEEIKIVKCNSLTEIVSNMEGSSSEQSLAADIVKFDQLHSLKMDRLRSLTDFSNDRATDNTRSKRNFKALFNHKVLFPMMKLLELSRLNNMISSIWDDQLSNNSFSNLRELVVRQCGFVKLIPFQVLKSLSNLEELVVTYCGELEMVFDLPDLNNDKETPQSSSVDVPLKKLRLHYLPKLKNVWSNHHNKGNVSFQSLRQVQVSFCESLTSVFPAFIAKGMVQSLEQLTIQYCGIEVIVAKDQVSESVAPAFVFSRLTFLYLRSLTNLRNFYPQRHKLEWPHIQKLFIIKCDELEVVEKTVSSSPEIHEEGSMLDSKHPLLSHDEVFRNLEDLVLDIKVAEMMGSGQFAMPYISKVKSLAFYVANETTLPDKPILSSFPGLERFTIGNEPRVDARNLHRGDRVAVGAAPFLKVALYRISNKKGMVPSIFSLTNVTHIDVEFCDQLTTLLTSSASRSLGCLTCLTIHWCDQIEEIITKQEGEDEEDREITFRKLQHLKLINLRRLKSFCGHNYTFKFPLLENVTIIECPCLTMFCGGAIDAPHLKTVKVAENPDENFWMNDLNNTIQHRFTAQEVIATTKSMAINATNISTITDVFPEVSTLYVENLVNEGVTFPFNSLERFPKLCWLHVEHSSFEEIFPSRDQITDEMEKVPPFKGLCLAYLDQLKSIWKDDSQLLPIRQDLKGLTVESCCSLIKLIPSSASFQILEYLKVSTCHQLIYLVTSSTAKSLVNLGWLEINDCKKMEEIIKNETNDDVEGRISFNRLSGIKLTDMPSLKMFSPQGHSFEFPKLEKIKINGCPQMKKFCGGVEALKLSEVKIKKHVIFTKTKKKHVME